MTRDPKTLGYTKGYAKAILEIARSEGQIDGVADELFRFARVMETEHELRQGLTDIALPHEAKEKLLGGLLKEKVSPHTLNILSFVVRQGRVRDLVGIADELARLAEEESRREIAEVRTAAPLDGAQTSRLAEALGKATGKNVSVKVIVDRSVLGGVLARVG
ncbi:MAG: ATP synthase F1 subunit delta, partial [Candidatus Methylomirabilales bacterium]